MPQWALTAHDPISGSPLFLEFLWDTKLQSRWCRDDKAERTPDTVSTEPTRTRREPCVSHYRHWAEFRSVFSQWRHLTPPDTWHVELHQHMSSAPPESHCHIVLQEKKIIIKTFRGSATEICSTLMGFRIRDTWDRDTHRSSGSYCTTLTCECNKIIPHSNIDTHTPSPRQPCKMCWLLQIHSIRCHSEIRLIYSVLKKGSGARIRY